MPTGHESKMSGVLLVPFILRSDSVSNGIPERSRGTGTGKVGGWGGGGGGGGGGGKGGGSVRCDHTSNAAVVQG